MKILLDERCSAKTSPFDRGGSCGCNDVVSGLVRAEERGLLNAAEEAGFELFIMADQEMSYQQNLKGRKMALVVLSTNNWASVKAHIVGIMAAVSAAKPGSYTEVEVPRV
jgi:hypothetical protein